MLVEGFSVLIIAIIIGLAVAWALKEKKPQPPQNPAGRMRLGLRQNLGQAGEEEEDGEEREDGVNVDAEKGINRKEAAKLARKEKKKQDAAARRAAIDEMRERNDEKQQERLKREEESDKREREEEERQKRLEEEKLKQEEEEYNKWKDLLAVESVGEEIQEEVFTLDAFLEYIKLRKVVMIEDLAGAFNLDGKAVVNRLHELENTGHLSGILDDRGKYIYITPEEFAAFKKYIEARGRVTRIELCNEGNRLIRMNPTPEDKIKIEAEERLIAEKIKETD